MSERVAKYRMSVRRDVACPACGPGTTMRDYESDFSSGFLCVNCMTVWEPSCVFPGCEAVPAQMIDALRGLCREHAPRRGRQPKDRVPLPLKIRFAVLERDGFRCRYCGRTADEVKLHVDHVKSLRDGGTDDLDNLAAACADCNHGKGARSMPQAGAR